jgi:ubiquinone/menaquinone biosynthesis C-methylase UbiE
MVYDKETLERMYKEGNPPWDYGRPCDQLAGFVNENKPCRALDVGCGTGTDAIFLAKNGFNVSAIDISEEAIKIARSKAEKSGATVDFRVADVLNIPFETETFEFVNDNGCFHQLDKTVWESFVKEVSRVMKTKARYLMKCFSDKEPPNPRITHRISKETIRQYFSESFNILYIRPIIIEGRIHGNHKGYSCLMERKGYSV